MEPANIIATPSASPDSKQSFSHWPISTKHGITIEQDRALKNPVFVELDVYN
jgi:hypothetical protein